MTTRTRKGRTFGAVRLAMLASAAMLCGLFQPQQAQAAAGDKPNIFLEQRVEATFQAWSEPFVPLRIPLIFNLRRDPYERAQVTSNTYYDWLIDRAFLLVSAQAYVGQFLETFKKYPPRQKAASFSLDKVLEALEGATGS